MKNYILISSHDGYIVHDLSNVLLYHVWKLNWTTELIGTKYGMNGGHKLYELFIYMKNIFIFL